MRGYLLLLVLVLLHLHFHGGHSQSNQTCDPDDEAALLAFSDGLDTKGAGLVGWVRDAAGAGAGCCSWTGVTCDLGRVVELDLSNRSLSRNSLRCGGGEAVAHLGRLPGLRRLNLSANGLAGAFPATAAGLFPAIEVVNVSCNLFNGSHPVFAGAARLTVLDITNNAFSGGINATALCASPVKVLRFSANAFSGDVPAGFGQCKLLTDLFLDGNGLTGSIPKELYMLPVLKKLSLQENKLSGSIGEELGNLSELTQIDLSYNMFSGIIPDVFGKLGNLDSLNLASNKLNGTLPSTLSNCPMLRVVSLRNNSLSGEIDIDFRLLQKLNTFDVGTNKLHGAIPPRLALCAELRTLNLARNKLQGELPESFKNLTSLSYLSLTGNGFTNLSSALQVLQNLPNLTSLVLTNNFRGGETMPMGGIEGFKTMQVFVLANCALSGTIPPWLQSLKNLNVLDISWNNLHGNIPPWLGKLDKLFYIDLSNNSFSGELPESFTQMKSLISSNGSSGQTSTGDLPLFVKKNSSSIGKGLQYNQLSSFPSSLILSNNELVGPIMPAFGRLVKLHVLDLGFNQFSGPIPDELSNMSSLEILDLAHNDLSGNIPLSLTKLNFLSKFDVSYNNLTGDIPTGGQFSTFASESFAGNAALHPPGNSSGTKKPSEAPHRKKNKATLVALGLGTAVGVILVLCVASVIISRIIHSRMQEHNPKAVANADDCSESPNSSLVLLFQNNKDLGIEDILKSTNNFDQSYIVGCGGFGLVYKSTLPDGRRVAIKRLSGDYSQIEREFQAEVETLSRAQHDNLVLLEGYCKIGNDRLLIYSYMENGSLDYWLHERADGGALLDWQKRLRIAQGSARGLAYLHLSCEPHILHRDIKSSNILLDENFEAHLADFGLARLICAYETHVTTDVVGTLGYIPPEYGQSPVATYKGDVYSFGIVLLELLTGRRPVDMCRPKGSRDVVSWVLQMKKEDRETEVFDPSIHDKENESQLIRVLEVALLCVTAAPKSRPTSQQLVEWLDHIAEG
uniref:non-specific serine/threonine protein kinase n=1 Tax=Leersia perrieri TaxID=77586 RepID=A0A0D9WB00_9ORYZ